MKIQDVYIVKEVPNQQEGRDLVIFDADKTKMLPVLQCIIGDDVCIEIEHAGNMVSAFFKYAYELFRKVGDQGIVYDLRSEGARRTGTIDKENMPPNFDDLAKNNQIEIAEVKQVRFELTDLTIGYSDAVCSIKIATALMSQDRAREIGIDFMTTFFKRPASHDLDFLPVMVWAETGCWPTG